MLHYRLYLLNDLGHITGAVDLDCDSDDEAVSIASTISGPRARELWEADRLVRPMFNVDFPKAGSADAP